MSVCPKCGYEGEFMSCPKCGAEVNSTIVSEKADNTEKSLSESSVQPEINNADSVIENETPNNSSAEQDGSLESVVNDSDSDAAKEEVKSDNSEKDDVEGDSTSTLSEPIKKKTISKKTIIIIAAVVAAILVGIIVGKLVSTHMHHAYLEKEYQGELTEESVGNVKISFPKNAEVTNNSSNSIKMLFPEGEQKIGYLLFNYEEGYNGSDLNSFLEKEYPDIEDNYTAEEITGSGYKGMIYTRERTSDGLDELSGAENYYDIVEMIKADESIFILQYIMDPKYYRDDNIATIHKHISLDKYKTPVIKFISPEYSGKTTAETPISEGKIEGLVVNATYEDGSKEDIVDKCTIEGPAVLTPGKDSKIDVSVKDWNGKEHTNSLTIKCTSKVKKVDADYNGSKKGGTKIDKNNDGLKVTAELDDGTKVTATSYTIDGPTKLKGGETNTYKITYGGVTDELKIEAQKSFDQVAESIVPEIKKSDLYNLEWFSSREVEYEANEDPDEDYPQDGYIKVNAWLDSGVYDYLSLAETGSKVGLTYETALLKMANYCSDIHDQFEKEGYDAIVYFYVWQPGAVPGQLGNPCYSYVDNTGIQRNPFAE